MSSANSRWLAAWSVTASRSPRLPSRIVASTARLPSGRSPSGSRPASWISSASAKAADDMATTDGFEALRAKVDELQGSLLAMECFLNALTEALPPEQRQVVSAFYASESAAFRAALMRSTAPEATVDTFERDVERASRLLGDPPPEVVLPDDAPFESG